ncbi:DUF4235 domain-containing protein [Actinoallomurus soli]|uniref:DUF4235 domain-containing protein n=1 Tax=Actinoallomurus soli TaxID=2952535 RepID=UPI002092D1CB|nr:DUF4235 domain-containing protein [Actinoallomurus soli]MCO5969040.1 DUF4235 domain-containing protein [Actinoallomurus soli]
MSKPDSISRPVSAVLGLAGGLIAGALFKQTWKLVSGQDDAPDAGDVERGWVEVLAAAALQGAIVGGVKAALNHGYLVRRHAGRSD